MSCFHLENVSYRYDKATVLQGVDLRLEPGEILACLAITAQVKPPPLS